MFLQYDWNIIETALSKQILYIGNGIVCADKLVRFLVIAEDRRYYSHLGFDFIAILRALLKNVVLGTSEGGSTIEQQLVRVLTSHYEKTFGRKIKEIVLATKLKHIATKKEIALVYLNIAYYGTDYPDLDAILGRYKKNKHSFLSDRICAEIVARLKYPEPHNYSEHRQSQIERRVNFILAKYKLKYK